MLDTLKRLVRPALLGVRRDAATGLYWYPVEGVRHYIRRPDESIRPRWRRETFDRCYFGRYLPTGSDCVVDFGAGLGTEIVMLAARSPQLRYIAVEIQPSVYECLCLTLAQLPDGFVPFGLGVAVAGPLRIDPTAEGIDAFVSPEGRIPVETVSWSDFAKRFDIGRIDLLKLNVEGAETALLGHVDLGRVERVIVNVHDFRAERGEGEHFRTRAAVESILADAGLAVSEAAPDWLYAERPS